MLLYKKGSKHISLSENDLREALEIIFGQIGVPGKTLVIPPDHTRIHSQSGVITKLIYEFLGKRVSDILPALGTHKPMTLEETGRMFGKIPPSLFRVHDWRNDLVTLGEVPEDFIREISGSKVSFSWPAQVNRMVANGGHDLIISVGQVVPHEVIGMANFNKNIFVGTGGTEGIGKSHFLGAVYGMERIMGRADNPVRQVLNYASTHFAAHLPIIYILTVVGKDHDGRLTIRGLFAGNDPECFYLASELSLQVNMDILEKPLEKVVVWLDHDEFRSTWLGNKSIYRTRMAMAENSELIILAPGVTEFGEDAEIDRLIRKYGYRNASEIIEICAVNEDINKNLSAAAHLIHGSANGRFKVTYCPGKLTRDEILGVGYQYADLNEMMEKYNPSRLKDGFNQTDGEPVFFISNPALGLWATQERMMDKN